MYESLPTDDAVAALAELAAGGPVLEFGIGTGRLALPLVRQGLTVHGVDGSPDMVNQLREKPGGSDIPVEVGDFADATTGSTYALVLLVFHTIFALPSQEAQVACFRNAAKHLRPAGRFVVEAWVPDLGRFRMGQAVAVLAVDEDNVVLEAAAVHPAEQTMTTTKVRLGAGGVQLFPANHRYAWPAELDLMAQLAGLTLEHRWADWRRTPFSDDSRTHVSVYRKAA